MAAVLLAAAAAFSGTLRPSRHLNLIPVFGVLAAFAFPAASGRGCPSSWEAC